ncbi:hypothetical protein HID58_085811 [Brassica napus]|uniref:Uncharacterized protein n=1 Tax=Brassica napus TaxID=3708 RepID=A0ABQ7XRG9_BRANA|nr:hypothetical protein HID58_085811 [Brassica napus]
MLCLLVVDFIGSEPATSSERCLSSKSLLPISLTASTLASEQTVFHLSRERTTSRVDFILNCRLLFYLLETKTKSFTMKDYSEMFSRWDGELEDEKADNIVKAVFSSGWGWEQSHWPLVGTKLWTNVKVEILPMKTEAGQMVRSLKTVSPSRTQSDAESRKKARESPGLDVETMKGEIVRWLTGLTSNMVEGLSRCENTLKTQSRMIEGLTTQVGAVEKMVREAARIVARAKSERQRRLAATQQSPFDGNSTAKVIIPNQPKQGQGYNPFANSDRQKLSALLDWVKLDPKWRQKVKGSSSHWFYILLTPTKWLIDTMASEIFDETRINGTEKRDYKHLGLYD